MTKRQLLQKVKKAHKAARELYNVSYELAEGSDNRIEATDLIGAASRVDDLLITLVQTWEEEGII